jgi:hypothetical protein
MLVLSVYIGPLFKGALARTLSFSWLLSRFSTNSDLLLCDKVKALNRLLFNETLENQK